MTYRSIGVGVLLIAGLAVAGCAAPSGEAGPATAVAVVPTRTDTPPTRTPPTSVAVAPGSVTVEPGPFTDRVAFSELAVRAGDRPSVTGVLTSTVDVSGVIVLTLRADFYDAGGRLLGSGTATYADEEFADTGAQPIGPGEPVPVEVVGDGPLTGAVSAVLTVVQLVNE